MLSQELGVALIVQESCAGRKFLVARQFVQNGPHWRHLPGVGDVPRRREQVFGCLGTPFVEIVGGLFAFTRLGEPSFAMVLTAWYCPSAACRIASAKVTDRKTFTTIAVRSQFGVTLTQASTFRECCISDSSAFSVVLRRGGAFDGWIVVVAICVFLRDVDRADDDRSPST